MLPVLLHFNFILIMIKYSIIVCTYNRYNFLIETIESVLTVLKNRSDFELLVIDNNSPDETSSIKEKYVLNTAVKYFLETQQGLSHARNRGIKEAVGKILVYLDDDIELVESYFETCDTIFSDASISISGGKVLPFKVEIPKWLPKKYYFLVSIYDLGDSAKYVKYLMGGNFAIRRNVALDIGFYNVELGRNRKKLAAGEEIDYQNRASLKGYKNYYHPDQNILHKINDKLNEQYVLTYSKELGRSERFIDALGSPLKVTIKIMKSYVAILLYKMFFDVITGEKRKKYLSIIYKYAEGYINKKIKVLKVGIDAKWYFDGPASGKMVIRNLVNEIMIK